MAKKEFRPPLFRSYPLGNDLKMAELVLLGLPSSLLKQLAKALGLKREAKGPG
jgi:hypothetical protein